MPFIVHAQASGGLQSIPTLQEWLSGSILTGLINTGLQLVGLALVVMFIYGGIMFMFAGDNAQNKAQAQAILFWAGIGGIVILASVFIVRIFIQLTGASGVDIDPSI